jgi:YYY domain-containing protein
MALAGFVTAAFLGLLLAGVCLAGWRTLTSGDAATRHMAIPLLLLAMALAVGLGVDFVRVGGDIGRMNTLFKLYLEVWALFSLASGFMLWHLAAQSVRPGRPGGLVRVRVWLKAAWAAALLVLVLAAAVYPVLGTQARWGDRWIDGGLTLDGTAYMRQAEHTEKDQRLSLSGDLEGIRWLQDNVEGSPVVLEAHHNQYHWTSRIAGYTGLPTVLGWPWHQIQQRGPYAGEVRQRARDVAAIYDTPDLEEARDLLARYEVEYVVVGELERAHYSATGLDKFARLVEQGEAALAFEGRTVQIFRISVPESN